MHDEIQTSLDEIFGVPPQMKLNPPLLSRRSQISSRSDFIHRGWISSAEGGFSWKKHTFVYLTNVCFFLVGDGGFGPPKSVTTDLQSAPFGRSGNPPYGAGERSRTINLLITNQLLCHWATPASVTVYIIAEQNPFVKCFFKIFKYFYFTSS